MTARQPIIGGIASVHMWGFFDDDGQPRLPVGVAPSDQSPYHHHRTVERNVTRCGGTITALRTTRTLDGLLVATEFEIPARDQAARMWHRIVTPDQPWPDPTTRHDDPEARPAVAELGSGCAA